MGASEVVFVFFSVLPADSVKTKNNTKTNNALQMQEEGQPLQLLSLKAGSLAKSLRNSVWTGAGRGEGAAGHALWPKTLVHFKQGQCLLSVGLKGFFPQSTQPEFFSWKNVLRLHYLAAAGKHC